MKLKFGAYEKGFAPYDYVYLKVFEHTSLVRSCHIEVIILEQFFKYGLLNAPLTFSYWEDGKDIKLEQQYTLNELLRDCEEIREYARIYFPEYAI